MAEPISCLASVITIVGCALESVKVLLKFFLQLREAPNRVRQWLMMLESLCSTLSRLQECGQDLERRGCFSTHFRQSLLRCVFQLRVCVSEIARIDADLVMTSSSGKRRWNQKARRSLERAKWAIAGDQKMKKVMKIVEMHHFEFTMELLTVLITTQPPFATPVNSSTESGAGHSGVTQLAGSRSLTEPPVLTSWRPESHEIPHSTGGIDDVLLANHHPNSSQENPENGFLMFSPDRAFHVSGSHRYVKPAASLCWSYLGFTWTIQAGPVLRLQREVYRVQSRRHRREGFGLIVSLHVPRLFRKRLGRALCTMQIMSLTSRMLHWSVDLPRTVSAEAEVFQNARAGRTENIQTLLSLGMATAKDVTVFGTTLLHSASKAGNVELVRLLIQEGADTNAQDEDGESALHGALARSGNFDIARILIEHGADLSVRSADGRTPFHTTYNDTIGQCLAKDEWLEYMSADSEGMTLTHFLAWSSRSTLAVFQRGRVFDSADLLAADSLGRNCLHFAAARGNLDILSHLMKQISHEDLEIKDTQGRTPLHYVAESSRAAEVIDILVSNGCDIGAIDGTGRTALHWAARRNNVKAVEKLAAMRDRQRLILYDSHGRLPSHMVNKQHAPDLFRYLGALESSNGLIQKALDMTSLHHRNSSYWKSLDFSIIYFSLGILTMILIILIGTPD